MSTVGEVPADDELGYPDVTFDVHEWFTGGHGDHVTVLMIPPGAVTSVGDADFAVDSRLLVSGQPRWGGDPLDSPIAWECGFTRTYEPDAAASWREAFASR